MLPYQYYQRESTNDSLPLIFYITFHQVLTRIKSALVIHNIHSMFRLISSSLGPPKLPLNNYFPWVNLTLHQSGTYLAPNRVCFRVPVHLTKLEIREYLRTIYGVRAVKVNTMIKLPKSKQNSLRQWYKTGAQFKKAYVTCEEKIPDAVKMLNSSKDLRKNPALTPGFFVNSNIKVSRPQATRDADWKPRHPAAWRETIPLLLRGKGRGSSGIPGFDRTKEMDYSIDKTLPFAHYSKERKIPQGVPEQLFPRVHGKELKKLRNAGRGRGSDKAKTNNLVRVS